MSASESGDPRGVGVKICFDISRVRSIPPQRDMLIGARLSLVRRPIGALTARALISVVPLQEVNFDIWKRRGGGMSKERKQR